MNEIHNIAAKPWSSNHLQMSYLTAARAIGFSKSFARLSLGAGPAAAVGPTIQVRTATKKVAGSRTNMRDSAGRRLGAKAAENEPVKPGQILMRQRGTKFYPGENASIGKDHTIFALEPGYVRFYLDPFHPKRKFIGVALRPDLRLPTDHFAPRVRRLGYVPIEDESKAQFEERNLKRKDHLQRPAILESLKQREEARSKLLEKYISQLSQIIPSLTEAEQKTAAERFLSIKNLVKNGIPLVDAQSTTTSIYLQNIKLQGNKGLVEVEDVQKFKTEYLALSAKVDEVVSFDGKNNLTKFTTEEEKLALFDDLKKQVHALFVESKGQETVKQIRQLMKESTMLNSKQEQYLLVKYVHKLEKNITNSKTKKKTDPVVFKQWNYEKRKVESIV